LEQGQGFDPAAHDELACTMAQQGAVLLKNEGGLLPAKPEDMVLIGSMAKDFRYQGAGSSHINPTRLTSLTDALPQVPYCPCGDKNGAVTQQELTQAAQAARQAKVAVVVAGLPDAYESEGFDRNTMAMPEGHDRMIQAVAAANPNTVVVLLGGSPMELPWCDQVKAILYMGLSGQAGGRACANLLTGSANPSGKLTESWPLRYVDVICKDTFGQQDTEYRESLYVGYRYYDRAGKAVRYPFGHGLSYTTFDYSDLQIAERTVTVTITNTGFLPGAEVVQLYVAPPQTGLHRPQKELKGFQRVELAPGACAQVQFTLDDRSFALWQDGWKIAGGTYQVLLGSSSRDIRLTGALEVAGDLLPSPDWQRDSWYETLTGSPTRGEWEQVMGHPVALRSKATKGQFTMDNSCMEMKEHSLIMKLQYKVTECIVAKSFGGKKDYGDPAFKMMMVCATDCPMRATVISSGGALSDGVARGLVEMANGHYLRGIKSMLQK
jgi:beta-glucosidase